MLRRSVFLGFIMCIHPLIRVVVAVAQPGRAPVCGTGGRGFKSRRSPDKKYTENQIFSFSFIYEISKWPVTNNRNSLNNSLIRVEIRSNGML